MYFIVQYFCARSIIFVYTVFNIADIDPCDVILDGITGCTCFLAGAKVD